MRSTRPSIQPARRRLFAGLGVAAAAAAATTAIPRHGATPAASSDAPPAPEAHDGYRATPHVLRYYRSART